MRASRALYAAAELGLADVLSVGAMKRRDCGPRLGPTDRRCAAPHAGARRARASSRSRNLIASASTQPVNCRVAMFPVTAPLSVAMAAGPFEKVLRQLERQRTDRWSERPLRIDLLPGGIHGGESRLGSQSDNCLRERKLQA